LALEGARKREFRKVKALRKLVKKNKGLLNLALMPFWLILTLETV
jgi:hypothetical protein